MAGLLLLLSGLLVSVFPQPSAGHSDPTFNPGYGASPNPVSQGQSTVLSASVSCFFPGCPMTYAEAYVLPEMNGVFPGAGNHNAAGNNGLELVPADSTWDADTEFASTTNNTAYLAVGDHDVYMRVLGCGDPPATGTCWSEWVSFVLTVQAPGSDTYAPRLESLQFVPDATISAGETTVVFRVTLDDSQAPFTSNIAGAGGPPDAPRYWINGCGEGLAAPNGYLTATDGAFDTAVESAEVTIDTMGWADNTYEIWVTGEDVLGNTNMTCAMAMLTVDRIAPDTQAPLASGGSVVPANVNVGYAGGVNLTATIDDSTRGSSNITAAEYFVDTPGADGAGTAMAVTDGAWSSASEGVRALNIDVSGWAAGTYTFYVHGRDNSGNWGSFSVAGEYTTATLTVGTPPPPIPGSPTGITLSVSGNNLVLTWTAPNPPTGLDHYNLYRATSVPLAGGCIAGAALTTTTLTTYTDTGFGADANRYFYNVRAANSLDQVDSNCVLVGKIAVDLLQGVNEISTPFLPTDPSPAGLFNPVWTPFVGVGAYDGAAGSWSWYNKTGGGPLNVIDNGMGLRVYMNAAGRLPLVGEVPTQAGDRAIAFAAAGWYFIGAPTLSAAGLTTSTAFDANGLMTWDRVLWYDPSLRYGAWREWHKTDAAFRDLATIQAGRGFWIQITAAGTWTPPAT